MAPIKFEENIKDKLEKRTLPPSENAWQRLEQRLDGDAKKQNKNKFWWFGVAAGFIGLLFVVQQFISFDASKDVITPIVVESENEIITNPVTTPLIIEESQQIAQETSRENTKENSKEENKNSVATTNTIIKNTVIKTRSKKQQAPVVIAQTKEEETPKALNTLIIYKDELVASVVNTIDASEKEETQIAALKTSESEIEALLNAANRNIQLTDNNTVNRVPVDANALLEDVETEMPPSLRGQLFKVITENFITATTAVTTRNE